MPATRLFVFLLAVWLSAAEVPPAEVDRLFSRWDKPGSAGCALAVLKEGQAVYQRGYGQANLDHNVPITPRTLFYLGSTSKQFTAATVLSLVRSGRLSLDAPVRTLLPGLPPYMEGVTVRHLLTHTSGVRDYLTLRALAGQKQELTVSQEDVLALLARQKRLNFPPGTDFLYSNSGYFLLSMVVNRAAGALDRVAAQEVLSPAGMKSTRYVSDQLAVVPGRATGYSPDGAGSWRIDVPALEVLGDTGVYSSLEDLAAWDRTFWSASAPNAQLAEPAALAGGRKLDYGYGMFLDPYRGLPAQSHPGGLQGYRSEVLRFPAQRLTVVCLCNAGDAEALELARRVADLYLGGQFPERAPRGPVISLPPDEQRRFAGFYREPESETLWGVRFTGAGLLLQAMGGAYPLQPVGPAEFRAANTALKLDVTLDGSRMVVDREGRRPFRLERVPFDPPPSPEECLELAGSYYSEELGVRYTVAYQGRLILQTGPGRSDPLQPARRGEFYGSGIRLNFERSEGKTTGFVLHSGRIWGLQFAREGL